MKNYKLDTKMLPKVWLTWETNKYGRLWLNCQTGKKKDMPEPWMAYYKATDTTPKHWQKKPDGTQGIGIGWYTRDKDKVWVQAGSSVKYAYAKYHADIDRLEVAAVGIKTVRAEEPRDWEFIGGRFFIGRDKSIIEFCPSNSNWYYVHKDHIAYSKKEIIRILLRLPTNNHFTEEFKKFIGEDYFVIGNGSTVTIEYSHHLSQWYETSQKVRGKGKQQKMVDMLTSIELSNAEYFAEKYPIIPGDGPYSSPTKNITYYERVNDEWSVLRSFNRIGQNLLEDQRIYLNEKGDVRVASKSKNEWIPSKYNCNYWRRGYTRLVNKNEAISDCKRIGYILKAVPELHDRKVEQVLVAMLRFPDLEQLHNMGHCIKALEIANSNTPKADIKHLFGKYLNEKEKSLLKRVGMNKFQLDFHMNYTSYNKSQILELMRKIFGGNLSHMDNQSFEKYYRACAATTSRFWRGLDYYIEHLDLDMPRFFKNMVRLSQRNANTYQVMSDTMYAYSGLDLNRKPVIDWYFDDYSDLTRCHDAIDELKRMQDAERMALYNMQEAERRKKEDEKRIKVDEKRKVYEYEDDEYIIRLPKDCNEIVQEGATQRICIGGYTTRHSLGNTNLFFLRAKSNPDKPFYAIEMNNEKSIVQIHGFGNRWLGNNPEAIPTVVRWLRKNDIKCSEAILTCKSTGYGARNEYVPMPVVD